jgi:hypothetical protein
VPTLQAELQSIQVDIRSATFTAVRAAEEQSANLKRLMDQSRLDASKTQEMLAQVLALLQADSPRDAAHPTAADTAESKTGLYECALRFVIVSRGHYQRFKGIRAANTAARSGQHGRLYQWC